MKRKLVVDQMDSSDEELVEKKIKQFDTNPAYCLSEKWGKFSDGGKKDSDKKLSFVAGAFGVGLLYSQKVNELYYGVGGKKGLKEKYLATVIDEETLKDIAYSAMDRTIDMFFTADVLKKNQMKSMLKSKLSQPPLSNFIQDIFENPENINIEIANQKLRITYQDDLNDKNFFDMVTETINQIIVDNVGDKKILQYKADFTNNFSTFYNRAYKTIVPQLKQSGIIAENKTASSRKDDPYKIQDKSKTITERSISETFGVIKESINDKIKNGAPFESTLKKKSIEPELAKAFFEDCKKSPELLSQQINQNLVDAFALKTATDLPDLFQSEKIQNSANLMANLRLSSRSATRKIARLNLSSQIAADNYDDYFDIKAESSDSRIWNVSGVPTREKQLVNSGSSRVDLVSESDESQGGKYPALWLDYQNLTKDNYGLNDKKLAQLVRGNLVGGLINDDLKALLLSVKTFVAKVTYLLFGCEVARNPASLIAHQMMLDLIISGKEEWKYFFGEAEKVAGKVKEKSKPNMPMAAEGAVPQARNLHHIFGDYMPWPYKYQGVEADPSPLLKSQNQLVEKWLRAKNINPIFLEEALILSCEDWYNIEMDKIIYRDKDNPLSMMMDKITAQGDSFRLSREDGEVIAGMVDRYYDCLDYDMAQNFFWDIGVGHNLWNLCLTLSEEHTYQMLKSNANLKALADRYDLIYKINDRCNEEELLALFEKNHNNSELIDDNTTVLITAIKIEYKNLAEKIIELTDDKLINLQDQRGNTALHYLVQDLEKNQQLISKLLEKGADPNLTNNHGVNPLETIIKSNWEMCFADPTLNDKTKLIEPIYKAALRKSGGVDKTGIGGEFLGNGLEPDDIESLPSYMKVENDCSRKNKDFFEEWKSEVKQEQPHIPTPQNQAPSSSPATTAQTPAQLTGALSQNQTP